MRGRCSLIVGGVEGASVWPSRCRPGACSLDPQGTWLCQSGRRAAAAPAQCQECAAGLRSRPRGATAKAPAAQPDSGHRASPAYPHTTSPPPQLLPPEKPRGRTRPHLTPVSRGRPRPGTPAARESTRGRAGHFLALQGSGAPSASRVQSPAVHVLLALARCPPSSWLLHSRGRHTPPQLEPPWRPPGEASAALAVGTAGSLGVYCWRLAFAKQKRSISEAVDGGY